MKRLLIIQVFFLVVLQPTIADDAYVYVDSGRLVLTQNATNQIIMESARIRITLQNDRYKVEGKYELLNTGGECTCDIGFPVYARAVTSEYYQKELMFLRSSFETRIDGKITPFEMIETTDSESIFPIWFVKKASFSKNQKITTSVSYFALYDNGPMEAGQCFGYVVGSGASWNGMIRNMTIEIVLRSELEGLNPILGVEGISSSRFTNKTVTLVWKDYEPNASERVEFSIEPILEESGYLSAYLLSRKLKLQEIAFLTKKQLSYMRNGIYAKKGYVFKTIELNRFFTSKKWYKPKFDNTKVILSDIDKYNVYLIQQLEQKR